MPSAHAVSDYPTSEPGIERTLATAAATQLMGLHLVFGAFLFGMIMPKTWSGEVRDSIARPIEFATKLLLVYFVITGFNVDLSRLGLAGVVDDLSAWSWSSPCSGKGIGADAGARVGGRAIGRHGHFDEHARRPTRTG